MIRKVQLQDEYDDEQDYHYFEEEQNDKIINWLPIVVVPLILAVVLWSLYSYSVHMVAEDKVGGQEFGVGGGPAITTTVTPRPTITPTPIELIE